MPYIFIKTYSYVYISYYIIYLVTDCMTSIPLHEITC